MGKGFLRRFVQILVTSSLFANAAAFADRIDDAIALSKRENRPLLAVGSADYCPPCRKLRHTLATDPSLQPILEKCVVLKMESSSHEFQNFVNRFPADASMIPMVYVVLPNGHPIYAQSGGLTGSQLEGILSQAISDSKPAKSTLVSAQLQIPENDLVEILKSARAEAQVGNLVKSLELVSPIADMPGESPTLAKARSYKSKLYTVISEWMNELSMQLEQEQSIHGASYRIAELYVSLQDHPELRKQAKNLLDRYEDRPATKNAVQQAKHLLQARHHEKKKECERAIENYSTVMQLDALSPAADFAERRIGELREIQAAKMTAQTR